MGNDKLNKDYKTELKNLWNEIVSATDRSDSKEICGDARKFPCCTKLAIDLVQPVRFSCSLE